MADVIRLLGLSQDGGLAPYILSGLVVWVLLNIRQLRADHGRMDAQMTALTAKVDGIKGSLATLTADVAALRGAFEANQQRGN